MPREFIDRNALRQLISDMRDGTQDDFTRAVASRNACAFDDAEINLRQAIRDQMILVERQIDELPVITSEGDIPALKAMLMECRDQFLLYEQMHLAKGEAGAEKARVNREFAKKIKDVLNSQETQEVEINRYRERIRAIEDGRPDPETREMTDAEKAEMERLTLELHEKIDQVLEQRKRDGHVPYHERRKLRTGDRDPRPIAIWDEEERIKYYSCSIEIQDAWNTYAQNEADKFNNEAYGPDRNTGTLHQWTPPLRFSQWYDLNYAEDPRDQLLAILATVHRPIPQMGYTNVVGLTFLDQWDAKEFVRLFEETDWRPKKKS